MPGGPGGTGTAGGGRAGMGAQGMGTGVAGGIASAERIGATPVALPATPESLSATRVAQPAGLAPEQAVASMQTGNAALARALENGAPAGMQALANPNALAKPGHKEQVPEEPQNTSEEATGGIAEESGAEDSSAPATRRPPEEQQSESLDEEIARTREKLERLLALKAQQPGLDGNRLNTPSRRLAA